MTRLADFTAIVCRAFPGNSVKIVSLLLFSFTHLVLSVIDGQRFRRKPLYLSRYHTLIFCEETRTITSLSYLELLQCEPHI